MLNDTSTVMFVIHTVAQVTTFTLPCLLLFWARTCFLTCRYTPEQVYAVVANVDNYCHFVPWCRASKILTQTEENGKAELVVGFPPVLERYTSRLTMKRPQLVKVSPMLLVVLVQLNCFMTTIHLVKPGALAQRCCQTDDYWLKFVG